MARTIAPGNPTPVQPVDVKIPDIDLEIFDKYGDAKIKSAMQNFNLYATSTINLESQKLYQQYKNNPIALANALSKLPDMFTELPESVQRDMKGKLDTTAISLVTKAQANQEKAIIKQNKALAHTGSTLLMNQLADDYFNVLRYITSPDEEKRPIDLQIYNAHRAQLAGMTSLTDENGNPLFSETQRAKMLMPKEAAVAGFRNFIGRAELKQLQDWDTNIFQDRDKFMKDTGIDSDTYDSMEQTLTKRLKQLEDTKTRTVHGQAYYDAINLMTQPTELAAEKAKDWDFTNKKDIDNIVKTSKEITQAKYYNPLVGSGPASTLQAINVYGKLIEELPDDPSAEDQQRAVAAIASANSRLLALAKETNMKPEDTDKVLASMKKALTDKLAKQAWIDSGVLNRASQFESFVKQPTLSGNIEEVYTQQLKRKGARGTTAEYQKQMPAIMERATQEYNQAIGMAMIQYLTGDYDGFKQTVAQADRNFDKKRASFIVKSEAEWQRLENALAQGQPAIVEYEGRNFEFKGFNNRGAMFIERN